MKTLVAAIILFSALPAQAQQDCAPRSEVIKRLVSIYGESLRGQGLSRRGVLVEWFANESSGTWTIISSGPDGTSCFASSGPDWHTMAEVLPSMGKDG